MDLLEGLNESQKDAVLAENGPMMILAAAGSGKTRTLVTKIGHLIKQGKVNKYELLAMTFSNKAAREMRERISSSLGMEKGPLNITTFHSYCARFLRKEGRAIGLDEKFTIYDDSESKTLVKTLVERRGLVVKDTPIMGILYYIQSLKNQGYYIGKEDNSIDKKDEWFSFFSEYENELIKANATDFGGLLTSTLKVLEENEDIQKRYRQKYKYIFIDEYQDTNRCQFFLLTKLCHSNSNVCVVGDEDQSIYSWRGADINNILQFDNFFSSSKLFKLEQNYRSSKNIIEAASFVIKKNIQRKGKEMWTDNEEGSLIDVVCCESDRGEADYVVDQIVALKKKKAPLRDIAVFYRNNAQSRLIEEGLLKRQIPYRVIGGIKFYDRKEIKDLLSYLKLIINPADSLSLSRVINLPTRGIGKKTFERIESLALDLNISLFESIKKILDDKGLVKLTKKVSEGLKDFVSIIEEGIENSREVPPSRLISWLVKRSGLLDMYKLNKTIEAKSRIENMEELVNSAIQMEEVNESLSLLTYLEQITLNRDTIEDSSTGEVSLMTVHGSKGLEFPYVFVIAVEEEIFPSSRSLQEDSSNLEEERRLFYVAMTRAMKKLTLSFCYGRMLFGQVMYQSPSRFISEIPEEYINKVNLSDSIDLNREKKSEHCTYDRGEIVYHKLYGEGIVLESVGYGREEKVLIRFEGGAKKKFMVKFAPIDRKN